MDGQAVALARKLASQEQHVESMLKQHDKESMELIATHERVKSYFEKYSKKI